MTSYREQAKRMEEGTQGNLLPQFIAAAQFRMQKRPSTCKKASE